jgi:hypothetical protein
MIDSRSRPCARTVGLRMYVASCFCRNPHDGDGRQVRQEELAIRPHRERVRQRRVAIHGQQNPVARLKIAVLQSRANSRADLLEARPGLRVLGGSRRLLGAAASSAFVAPTGEMVWWRSDTSFGCCDGDDSQPDNPVRCRKKRATRNRPGPVAPSNERVESQPCVQDPGRPTTSHAKSRIKYPREAAWVTGTACAARHILPNRCCRRATRARCLCSDRAATIVTWQQGAASKACRLNALPLASPSA